MKKNIGWIGLGKCGLPIAEEIGKIHNVIAVDIFKKHTQYAEYKPNVSYLLDTEAVFILVQTPHAAHLDGSTVVDLNDLHDFDYSALESVLQELTTLSYRNPVIISSTVSPGTISRLATKYSTLSIVYMPVMIHIGSVAHDYLNAPAYIIGSADIQQGMLVESILRTFVNTETFMHLTYNEVEIYKLMNNIYTSLKILFVNQITEIIEKGKFNASSWNIMEALKTDVKNFASTRYLTPGSGNGGPCHPRDSIVLGWLTDSIAVNSQFSISIIQAREQQARTLAEHLVSYELPIVILGKSFKMGVDLETGSYSVLVGNQATALGGQVYYDTKLTIPAVIVLMHPDAALLDRYAPADGSTIVDLWNLSIGNDNVKVWGNRKSTI